MRGRVWRGRVEKGTGLGGSLGDIRGTRSTAPGDLERRRIDTKMDE